MTSALRRPSLVCVCDGLYADYVNTLLNLRGPWVPQEPLTVSEGGLSPPSGHSASQSYDDVSTEVQMWHEMNCMLPSWETI